MFWVSSHFCQAKMTVFLLRKWETLPPGCVTSFMNGPKHLPPPKAWIGELLQLPTWESISLFRGRFRRSAILVSRLDLKILKQVPGRDSGNDFRGPEIGSDNSCFSFILFSYPHVVPSGSSKSEVPNHRDRSRYWDLKKVQVGPEKLTKWQISLSFDATWDQHCL